MSQLFLDSAAAFALAALGGETPETAEVRRVSVTSIAPDPLQPRTYFDSQSLAALGESLRSEGQIQAINVRFLGAGKYELISGERRWRAAQSVGLDALDAVVWPFDTSEEKRLDIQTAENIQRDEPCVADICRTIERYVSQFQRSYKYLGENQLLKLTGEARDKTRWVGDRARTWAKAKHDPALVELLTIFRDTYSHVELIVTVDEPGVRRRLIAAAKKGASTGELRAMIPAKPAPMKTPSPFSPASRQVETSSTALNRPLTPEFAPISRQNEMLSTTLNHSASLTRDELNEAAAALDWTPAPEVPAYDSDSLNRALDTVRWAIQSAAKQVPIVATSATYDATAREAFSTQIARIAESVQAMAAAL